MNTPRGLVHFFALCLLLGWLAGCVQTKTTPGYARAGDHIVVGLAESSVMPEGNLLKASDLSIILTDADNVQYTLQARFVFKAYPEHGATMNSLYFNDVLFTSLGLSNMVPFDGGWFAVLPLTTPGQYDDPLPLAVGQASVSVTSSKLTNINNANEGDLTAIPIEIIPGTSPEDVDFVRQFTGYVSTGKSFLISPDSLAGIDEVGGAYLVINYNDETFFKDGVEPVVVPVDHNPYVQLNYNVVPNGDGTGSIYVTLLNPAGFKTSVLAGPSSSRLSNLSVKLLYYSEQGTAALAKTTFSIDAVDSYYIDMNGSVLSGVSPTLTHYEDL